MARYGHHDGWRGMVHELVDEGELPLWPERGLQHDDVVACPGTRPSLGLTDGLDGNTQASGRGKSALREHEIVLYHIETPCQQVENTHLVPGVDRFGYRQRHLSLL
jgi:hypothetical protein